MALLAQHPFAPSCHTKTHRQTDRQTGTGPSWKWTKKKWKTWSLLLSPAWRDRVCECSHDGVHFSLRCPLSLSLLSSFLSFLSLYFLLLLQLTKREREREDDMIWEYPLTRFGCDIMQSSIKEHGEQQRERRRVQYGGNNEGVHGMKKRNEKRGTYLLCSILFCSYLIRTIRVHLHLFFNERSLHHAHSYTYSTSMGRWVPFSRLKWNTWRIRTAA